MQTQLLTISVVMDSMVSLFGYYMLGIVVLSQMDKDGKLIKWYRSAPNELCQLIAMLIWPVLAYKIIRRNK